MEGIEGQLYIIGTGPLEDDLQQQAQRYGLENKITFLGHVNRKKLNEMYEVADVFVLPSVERSEAFGIVQLEAMARETPVVNTKLPTGVPWVSLDGKTGLTVQPKEPHEIETAVNTLIQDDDLRCEYGKNARKRVENKFTKSGMISKMEDIYQNIRD